MHSIPSSINYQYSLGNSALNFGGQAWCLIFHPDGRSVHAVFGNEFRRYDLKTGDFISSFTLKDLQVSIRLFRWLNDDEFLIGHGINDHIHEYTRHMICYNDQLWHYKISENKIVKRWSFPKLDDRSGTKIHELASDLNVAILSHYNDTGNQKLLVWDLKKNKSLSYLPGKGPVRFLNEKEVISVNQHEKKIYISELADGSERSFPYKGSWAHSIACTNNDLIAITTDTHLQLFNPQGELLNECPGEFQFIEFTDNGKSIVSTLYPSGLIRVLDSSTLKITQTFQNQSGYEIKYSPDISSAANAVSYFTDKGYHILDLNSGEELLKSSAHSREIVSIQFGPLNNYVLTRSADGCLIVWNGETEVFRTKVQFGDVQMSVANDSYFFNNEGSLAEMKIPSGEFVTRDTRVAEKFFLDEKNGKVITYLEDYESDQYGWSSWNIGILAVSVKDKPEFLWKKKTNLLLKEGKPLGFSSDGLRAFIVNDSRVLECYDARTGRIINSFNHTTIYSPVFLQEHHILISCAWQNMEKWDLKSPDKKPLLLNIGKQIDCFSVSKDASLAAAMAANEFYLIDLLAMKVILHTPLQLDDTSCSVSISTENDYVLIGMRGGLIHKYRLE